MSDKKSKKEKVTYVDDGRPIADMSNLPPRIDWTKRGTSSSFKDIWHTYWQATKMMLLPTLAAVGFLIVIYLIVALVFKLM
ncbi:MAG: hypothetical protein IKL46_06530 [Clostridia bacterium]|nr:hypothetical protein [Clostridia bacterium]